MEQPGVWEGLKAVAIVVGAAMAAGMTVFLIFGLIAWKIKTVVGEWERKTTTEAEEKEKSAKQAENVARWTRANLFAGYLAEQMWDADVNTSHPNLDIIADEFARARAAHWDFSLPSLNIDLSWGCWQAPINDQKNHDHPLMTVVITPSGQWAIMGTGYMNIIKQGEMTKIGGVPWVIQSTTIPSGSLTDYHIRVLTGGIRSLLIHNLPDALDEFDRLRNA
jgi:hypothetical protein